jgi:hypothetical protein
LPRAWAGGPQKEAACPFLWAFRLARGMQNNKERNQQQAVSLLEEAVLLSIGLKVYKPSARFLLQSSEIHRSTGLPLVLPTISVIIPCRKLYWGFSIFIF